MKPKDIDLSGLSKDERIKLVKRFLKFVERTPDGHWIWTGGTTRGGHGRFKFNGKTILAHRLSWELFVGSIELGKFVLHLNSCHTPHCVCPFHLYEGTNQDNMRDKVDLGTQACGEHNGRAKLTDTKIKEIRHRSKNGETNIALAKEFGVSDATISQIHLRQIWKHV